MRMQSYVYTMQLLYKCDNFDGYVLCMVHLYTRVHFTLHLALKIALDSGVHDAEFAPQNIKLAMIEVHNDVRSML